MSLLDIPLQFHEFQHLDHLLKCPKYSECLQKLEPIGPNDLDALYTDLELLQGASNIRLRRLEEEIKILTEWCDKKDRNKGDVGDLDFLSNVSTNKRSHVVGVGVSAEEPVGIKKQKVEDSSSLLKSNSLKIKSKGKVLLPEPSDNDVTFVPKPKPTVTNDNSNKFWSHVEPYCADITLDDIKLLEDTITSKGDNTDYFKVPPLGPHYSDIWAKEDMIEEHQQNMKIDKKKLGVGVVTPANGELVGNLADNLVENLTQVQETEENCPYGRFTKYLVAALVDENIMAPMTENEIVENNNNTAELKMDSKALGKKAPIQNCAKNLEVAIKEELFALGLIDATGEGEEQDDEILQELRRCQSVLRALRSHNKHSVNKLINLAKAAIKKQEVKQKAKVLDAEVQDIFRRFCAAKAKKKGLSRKDREYAWKALRDREALWKLVDNSETDKVD